MITRNLFTFTLMLICLSLLMTGCGSDSPNSALDDFQPEIINVQDSFSFQATDVTNVSTVLTYNWLNGNSRATINHSSALTGGSAEVVIYDADDVQVYTNALASSLNEASSAGTAGMWRVVVTLVDCSGTLNFRAEAL